MIAPGGGYCGRSGDPPIGEYRIRYASRGWKRYASDRITSSWRDASWCSGEMLSMIQNDRPIVASTRSLWCTRMSVTGVAGRFCWNDCQWRPLSNDTNIPNSVPA